VGRRRVKPKQERLGSWVLPSGNGCLVSFCRASILRGRVDHGLEIAWDDAPRPHWPLADVRDWQERVYPQVLEQLQDRVGLRVLGARLTANGAVEPLLPRGGVRGPR
jgi:hypothetical protein